MSKNKNYYKQFQYIIFKKFSVQDRKEVKDYAKLGVYFYILQENQDKNRFLFISNKHYEEKSLISPETFNLLKVDNHEELYLKFRTNKFKEKFLTYSSKENKDKILINLRHICFNKKKEENMNEGEEHPFFSKLKIHTKKIAIDNPNFAIETLKSIKGIKSYKKKFEKLAFKENHFNDSIKENFFSTLFTLRNSKYMLFNDHTIHLDQGKTGKSSLITSMSSKSDNISIAGLYGSSDSKNATFKGGLISTTNNSICLDELNELVEDNKNDKILSILNTFLENGVYNYNKQFSGKVTGGNQFIFLGNITEEFNFGSLMINLMGNPLTFGRRIGIIAYNTHLKGFKPGGIIEDINPYNEAVKIYLSQIFNYIIYETKFYKKTINHNKYYDLKSYYSKEVNKLISLTENETIRHFLNSHKEDIKRQICRSLKLYLYENLDLYIQDKKLIYSNDLVYKILELTKTQLDNNLFNLNNIVRDINATDMNELENANILKNFEKLNKLTKNTLQFLWYNKKDLTIRGIDYDILEGKNEIKKGFYEFKKGRAKPTNLINNLKKYGIVMKLLADNKIMFYLSNENMFNNKCLAIFDETSKEIDVVTTKNTSKDEPEKIDVINMDEDII